MDGLESLMATASDDAESEITRAAYGYLARTFSFTMRIWNYTEVVMDPGLC